MTESRLYQAFRRIEAIPTITSVSRSLTDLQRLPDRTIHRGARRAEGRFPAHVLIDDLVFQNQAALSVARRIGSIV